MHDVRARAFRPGRRVIDIYGYVINDLDHFNSNSCVHETEMDACALLNTLSLFLWHTTLAVAVHIQPINLQHMLTTDYSDSLEESSVVLRRELLESGYHRLLFTEVFLTSEELVDSSQLIIAQNITSSMYLDIDQLSSLQSLTGEPQLIVSEHMNTEQPTSLSSNHVSLAYTSSTSNRLTVRLPVHFRYQSPCDSQYISVTISPPILLLPYKAEWHNLSSTALPCNATTTVLCAWHRLAYTDLEHDTLQARIPCGNQNSLSLVVATTLIVTLVAAVCVCIAIASVQHHTIM